MFEVFCNRTSNVVDERSRNYFDSHCYWKKPCIRFCCENETLCNQKYIDGKFNASILPDDTHIGWNSSIGIKAILKKPTCSLDAMELGKKLEFGMVNDTERNYF
jgi:hypothetical protein